MDAWKIHQVENQVSRSPNWGGFLADVFWLQIPPPNKNIQSRSWYLKARSWQWSSPASWWGRNRLSQLRMTWGIFWSGGRWGNARNGNFPSREGLASFQKLVCVQDMVFHWTAQFLPPPNPQALILKRWLEMSHLPFGTPTHPVLGCPFQIYNLPPPLTSPLLGGWVWKRNLCSQGGQTRSWAKMATKGAYPTIHLYNITVMQSNSCFIRLLRQLSFYHHPTHRHWFWSAGWRCLICPLAPPHILCWGAPFRFITCRHHLPLCYCAALHLAHVTSTLLFTNT